MQFRKKHEIIAMILAGGQGSRLCSLTDKTAKPAVPFGGKYRIIDFTLSNCVNSGIDTVGVLTQYQPLVLNEYIGNGQPWDLDRINGGVCILPPYQAKSGAEWYSGTANAIYQNSDYISRYSPDYLLILSGDHIYKMDYSKMLRYHKEKNADVTVAVINVPVESASRFGIMSTDDDGRITEFNEKPKEPKGTLASMGIYIFNTEKLNKYLALDNEDKNSSNDFGKNLIPKMLQSGERLYAYGFNGYWKDVGTIPSYWEANMDLLGEQPKFKIQDHEQKIYSRSEMLPPHYIGEGAEVKNSLLTEGCTVYGKVENSVLFGNVYIERGAYIKDSIIFYGAKIGKKCRVIRSIISEEAVLEDSCCVGNEDGEICVIACEDNKEELLSDYLND